MWNVNQRIQFMPRNLQSAVLSPIYLSLPPAKCPISPQSLLRCKGTTSIKCQICREKGRLRRLLPVSRRLLRAGLFRSESKHRGRIASMRCLCSAPRPTGSRPAECSGSSGGRRPRATPPPPPPRMTARTRSRSRKRASSATAVALASRARASQRKRLWSGSSPLLKM